MGGCPSSQAGRFETHLQSFGLTNYKSRLDYSCGWFHSIYWLGMWEMDMLDPSSVLPLQDKELSHYPSKDGGVTIEVESLVSLPDRSAAHS